MEVLGTKVYVTVAIVAICYLHFIAGLSETRLAKDIDSLALDNLGMIEGKIFYAEPNQTMTWREAGSYCSVLGLRLATIENREQSDFLATAIIARYRDYLYFWTAGRDSRLVGSMQWNTTGGAPTPDIFGGISHEGGSNYIYCGVVDIHNDRLYLHMEGCDWTNHVLCELA